MLPVLTSRPIVLCYHAVSETWTHPLSVTPEVLERHLSTFLHRGYLPVRADRLLREGGRLLHVTFDDGFRSVRNALPVLERLNVPTTVFVCSAYADDGRPFDKLPGGVTETDPSEIETLDWDGLRALINSGVEIGSHTQHHPYLTSLPDSDLMRELSLSRERIETELGQPCRFVAYPYGDSDTRVEAAARAAGYAGAFRASGPDARQDRYAFPRTTARASDTPFRLRLRSSRLAGTSIAARGRRRLAMYLSHR